MMPLLTYFALTLTVLIALAAMIQKIAGALADCPEKGRRARAAGLTIASGFLALGAGAVLMIASLPALDQQYVTIIFAMGLACVILGLGFTHAVRTLRNVVEAAPKLAGGADAPVPMEPVLL